VKKYEIDYRRSISLGVDPKWRNGEQKRLGFIFGYILITTPPITMMLTATEIGKDWVFLGTGVRIYRM